MNNNKSSKVSLLLDEPCPELLCGLCSDVLRDPMQVHCPEDHMFCSTCIQKYIENGQSTCPLCFTLLEVNSFQLSKFVSRQIGRLRIKCCYSTNGCVWQGIFSDSHMDECTYAPCICPNEGCDVQTTNEGLQEHLNSCLYQVMTCPNNMPICEPFKRKDLSMHENTCPSYVCSYSTEGCAFIGTLNSVNIHYEGYCNRLHMKIQNLELEVKRLNDLISLSASDTMDTSKEEVKDSSIDEMALFHEIFNNNNMDIINNGSPIQEPLQFIPPLNVPKRTSNGKKIRYSKNVRLAHSALRIARERTASNNPSNDAILNNLDLAKQKQQKITFKDLNDVTEFLNTDTTNNQLLALPTCTNNPTSPSIKKRNNASSSVASSSPPSTPTNTNSNSPLKRRPMFILASSYLSNYNKE